MIYISLDSFIILNFLYVRMVNAEFFDIFGIFIFAIILIIGILIKFKRRKIFSLTLMEKMF